MPSSNLDPRIFGILRSLDYLTLKEFDRARAINRTVRDALDNPASHARWEQLLVREQIQYSQLPIEKLYQLLPLLNKRAKHLCVDLFRHRAIEREALPLIRNRLIKQLLPKCALVALGTVLMSVLMDYLLQPIMLEDNRVWVARIGIGVLASTLYLVFVGTLPHYRELFAQLVWPDYESDTSEASSWRSRGLKLLLAGLSISVAVALFSENHDMLIYIMLAAFLAVTLFALYLHAILLGSGAIGAVPEDLNNNPRIVELIRTRDQAVVAQNSHAFIQLRDEHTYTPIAPSTS